MKPRFGRQDTSGQGGWQRFVGIVAVYVLVGPLLGALLLFCGLVILVAVEQPITGSLWGDIRFVGVSTIFWLPLAYLIGMLPAVVIGFGVAVWEKRKGLISMSIALAVSFVMWILLFSRSFDPFIPDDPGTYTTWLTPIACLGSTWMCTWLVRLWHRKPPPVAPHLVS